MIRAYTVASQGCDVLWIALAAPVWVRQSHNLRCGGAARWPTERQPEMTHVEILALRIQDDWQVHRFKALHCLL